MELLCRTILRISARRTAYLSKHYLSKICSQNSFLRDWAILRDNIHPKLVPHVVLQWDLNWAERFDKTVCYIDDMQFIFPNNLHLHNVQETF